MATPSRRHRRPSLRRQRDRPRQRAAGAAQRRGSMRARYVIESERWSEMTGPGHVRQHRRAVRARAERRQAAAIAPRGDGRHRRAAEGLGAGQDAGAARAGGDHAAARWRRCRCLRDGMPGEAFAMMERGGALQARMPKPIGRPFPVKGADELYGELLLRSRPAEGGGRVVRHARWRARPNRSRAVLGLARAAAKAGDAATQPHGLQAASWRTGRRPIPACRRSPKPRLRSPADAAARAASAGTAA